MAQIILGPDYGGTYRAVGGDTLPIRDELARLGGQWDALNRVWWVPADAIPAIVAAARAAQGGPSEAHTPM